MAFPTISTVLDNFNRADEGPPPSSNWSGPCLANPGQLKVVSNALAGNAADYGSDGWNPTTFGPDTEVRVSVSVASGNMGLFLRLTNLTSSTPDGYLGRTDSVGNWVMARFDAGTYTQLGATINEFGTINGIGLEMIGSTLALYRYDTGWVSIGSRTDATYSAAGYIGARINNTTARFDDFIGGTISSGVSVTPAAATAAISKIDPTVVLGSTSVTPAVATAAIATVNPDVVLGSIVVAPAVAFAATATVDPTVILGSLVITPSISFAAIATVDPTVVAGGDMLVTPAAGAAAISTVTPTVVLGSDIFAPAAATLRILSIDPTVLAAEPLISEVVLAGSFADAVTLSGSFTQDNTLSGSFKDQDDLRGVI